MRKTKKIVIEEPLSFSEFEKIKKHAYNSSFWYVENYVRNTNQVKERLYKKGYKKDSVRVIGNDGQEFVFNIVDDVIEKLIDFGMIDDKSYAESLIRGKKEAGYGDSYVRTFLLRKGFDAEILDEILEDLKEDEDLQKSGIEKSFERIINTSSYKNKTSIYEKKQKVFQALAQKGHSFDDINHIISEKFQDME